jgi:hypothetical protein
MINIARRAHSKHFEPDALSRIGIPCRSTDPPSDPQSKPFTMLLWACSMEHKPIDLEMNEFVYRLHTEALAPFKE